LVPAGTQGRTPDETDDPVNAAWYDSLLDDFRRLRFLIH